MRSTIKHILGLFFLTTALFVSGQDFCRVYGSIYIADTPVEAQYQVFIQEDRTFADLTVYESDLKVYADRTGIWYITDVKAFADYIVYFVKEEGLEDFSIYITDYENEATCE